VAVEVAIPRSEPALSPWAGRFAGIAAISARWWLSGLVLSSFLGRFLAAASHVSPYYLPDEYIYPSLARSLAETGRPLIRNAPAHFPALLEPLLSAPLWLVGDAPTAYRLTQGLHALFFSFAAVPVYLLARRLSLGKGLALGAAALALTIPDGVYAGAMLADAVAYPLVLFAVYFGICAIAWPTRRTQVWFAVFSLLAVAARVQFFVLPLAVFLAAVVVERGRAASAVRSLRLSLALLVVPPAVVFGALGPATVLGPYMNSRTGVHPVAIGTWVAREALLLVYSSGWVLIPGGLVALALGFIRPRSRIESAFAAVVLLLALGLMLEAAQIADTDSHRYAERYLFALLPLAAIAFGRYVYRGLPGRLPVALLSTALVALSARVPLSGYAVEHARDDSPTLWAVARLTSLLASPAGSSFVVAAGAAVLSLLALAVPLRPRALPAVALAAAAAATLALSAGATSFDGLISHHLRENVLPRDERWVDHSGLSNVALLQLPGSRPENAWQQLFWNRTITSELLLGSPAIDQFASARVRVARNGRLLLGDGALRRPILAQTYGSTVTFSGARRVARSPIFGLWRPEGTPRLRMLAAGRYYDGWLAGAGAIILWPVGRDGIHGRLDFTVSMPKRTQVTVLSLDGPGVHRRVRVAPGEREALSLPVSSSGPWQLRYRANKIGHVDSLRAVSVRASVPRLITNAG
jgi:hypothetical protein